jgi:acetyl esterase/lipase
MIVSSVSRFAGEIIRNVSETHVIIFSVEYRLAHENKDTGLLEDCYAGLQWPCKHAASLNIDIQRIAVMGEGAGGGIAAGVALMARDKKLEPALAMEILAYPMLDDQNNKHINSIEPYTF